MPEFVVSRFAASYHGTVKVRKVKEKFLRRLIALELEERPDIPKPFTFGFKVLKEEEAEVEVSLSVVKEEEVLDIVKNNPDVDCIVSEEVALASCAKKVFGEGVFWCVGAYPDGIRLSLSKDSCVLYSTVVPVMGEEPGEGELELINSTFRYAYNIVGQMPEKGIVVGPWAEPLAGMDLIVPLSLVDEITYDYEDVEPYNLIPTSILEERRARRIFSLVEKAVVGALVAGLCVNAWLGYNFFKLRGMVSEKEREIEEVHSVYERVVRLRSEAESLRKMVEKEKGFVSSFETANLAYDAYRTMVSLGYVAVEGIKGCCGEISLKGRLRASSRAQGFLLYTDLVSSLRAKGKVVFQSYNPETKTFEVKLRR